MTRVIALIIWALALVGMFITTAHRDPVAQGTLRASDLVVDDTMRNGSTPLGAGQKVLFSDPDVDTATQVWISSLSSNHVGQPGNNEMVSLVINNATGFDNTADPGKARGLEIAVSCTDDVGVGCISTGVQVQSDGFAWYSTAGSMYHEGAVEFSGTSGTVDLGDNVEGFNLPGTTGTATQQTIGWPNGGTPGNVFSGVGLAVKNAQPGVSVGGVGVALDTTVEATIRGGFIISRGAGGGLAGNNSGIAVSGGTGFPFLDSAANQFNVYAEQGPIVFGASTAFTPAFRLSQNDHLVAATTSDAGGTPVNPSKSAACDAGGGSAITGNDMAFKLTTGATSTACVVTFIKTYTVAPVCVVTPEGGIALPTFTTTATTLAMTVNVAGVYNVMCWGTQGAT